MIQSVARNSTRAAVHLVHPQEGVLGSLRMLSWGWPFRSSSAGAGPQVRSWSEGA